MTPEASERASRVRHDEEMRGVCISGARTTSSGRRQRPPYRLPTFFNPSAHPSTRPLRPPYRPHDLLALYFITMHLGPSSPGPPPPLPILARRAPLDITLRRIGVMPSTEAHHGYRHIVCPLALGTTASVVASGAEKTRAPSQQACA